MLGFPYTLNTGKIKPFLEHVQSARTPPKLSQKYLESAGFKSKNDRALIGVMEFIGFVDSSHSSTDNWRAYRNTQRAGGVLAKAIVTSYGELFGMYVDAFRKDDKILQDYFSSKTTVSKSTVGYMVRTFKVLCELADFEAVLAEVPVPEPIVTPPPREGVTPKVEIAPGLQINIEIHIAADTPDDKIETIFKNMKKYLLTHE